MSSLNQMTVIGKVGSLDIVTTKNGKKIAKLSIATSHNYKDAQGNWVDATEWHRAVVSNENIVPHVEKYGKGDTIFVQGELRTNEWENKDGQKVKDVQIWVQTVKKLLTAAARTEAASSAPPRQSAPAPQAPQGDPLDFLGN